jgi:hypothetical protein
LRPHPIPGLPPKLSASQKKRLATLLLKDPLAAGYRTDLRTLQHVAQRIRRQWGVDYHPCHVWKLLTSLGWSCQKPEGRALQRDDAAVAHWKHNCWPQIRNRSTWPCLPSGTGWPFISRFGPATSRGWMCEHFCDTCSGIFRGRSSCCGIGERSIAVARSHRGLPRIHDSRWKRSRPMPRNSIQRNMSGPRPTAPRPTVRPRTWPSSTGSSATRCGESEGRNRSCGPVSTRPIRRGHGEPFHYFCTAQ